MHGRILRGLALLAATLGVAAPATAQPMSYDALGLPGMSVDGAPTFEVPFGDPAVGVSVHRCVGGDAVCGPALPLLPVRVSARAYRFDVKELGAGDVLEVRRFQDGQVLSATRTPAWRGVMQAITRPMIEGTPAVGQEVRAVAGTWTDAGWTPGWTTGYFGNKTETLFVACKTPRGTGCRQAGWSTMTIDESATGRYLFALSSRTSRRA